VGRSRRRSLLLKSLVELNRYLGIVNPEKERPLAFLRDRDKQMLLLYLQGTPPTQIVDELKTSMGRFRRVMKSDLGKLVIDDYFQFCDQEFSTLYQLSVDAIRQGLESEDIDTKLKAADKFLKAHGKYDKAVSKEATAEDVVRRILEVRKDSIRMVEETRRITKDAGATDTADIQEGENYAEV